MKMRRTDFSLAFCGVGPASSGLLFYLVKSGLIASLGDQRILLVERGKTLGGGCLSEYKIGANSLADAILECLCDKRLASILSSLERKSPGFRELEFMKGQAPPLAAIGSCLTEATERLIERISGQLPLSVQREHHVDALTIRNDGCFEIETTSSIGEQVKATSASVILNLGGRQAGRASEPLKKLLGTDLLGRLPVIGSDVVLRQPERVLVGQFAHLLKKRPSLIVAGGSHSAFSVVERLARVSGQMGLARIVIVHRSPIRFFHKDIAEARAAGDSVDQGRDVCPLSGRVNRFGGLRYRAAELARAILESNRVDGCPVEIITRMSPNEAAEGASASWGEDAAAIIAGLGYEPRLPTIRNEAGETLILRIGDGGLITDAFGRPFDQDDTVIPGLFSFGLGSGLRVGQDVGGELGYKGRLDGAWLYHNDVGRKVATGLITDLRRHEGMCSLRA